MMDPEELVKVISENPGCHIHYWDNGSWSLYAKGEIEKYEEDGDYELIALAEGDDGDGYGYCGSLVVALGKLLNITVDSI